MCTPLSELFHFCEMCESVACLLILSLVVCCQLCFVFTSPASSCDYCQLFLLLASLPPVFIISVYSCPLSSSSALFWLLFRSDFTFLLLCTAKIPATFHMTNPQASHTQDFRFLLQPPKQGPTWGPCVSVCSTDKEKSKTFTTTIPTTPCRQLMQR